MELTDSLKALFMDTARSLNGSARRLFMARTVKERGPGGQRHAERALGWSRGTIRQGTQELDSGFTCLDAFAARGRQPVEAHLPALLRDMQAIVASQSQTEPQFRTTRLSTRLSAAEVRRPLIAQHGYAEAARPTVQTLTTTLNALGDYPKKVAKSQPAKKIPETDAICAQVTHMNHLADQADNVLRLSRDAKAIGKVGPFARGGQSRVRVEAADHDCQPEATVTPVGILLPTLDELLVYGLTSKGPSDGRVDRIAQWWETVGERFAHLTTLGIHLDNGPENHSRRTQFMPRLVEFGRQDHVRVRLAYDPPYHSKDQPIERCWGMLEHHCNGALLDSMEAVLAFTRTMTWNGVHPVRQLVTTTYQTGVKLTKAAMDKVEAQLQRLPH